MDVDQLAHDLFAAKRGSRAEFTQAIIDAAAATGMNASALTRAFNRAAGTRIAFSSVRQPQKLAEAIRADIDERNQA